MPYEKVSVQYLDSQSFYHFMGLVLRKIWYFLANYKKIAAVAHLFNGGLKSSSK